MWSNNDYLCHTHPHMDIDTNPISIIQAAPAFEQNSSFYRSFYKSKSVVHDPTVRDSIIRSTHNLVGEHDCDTERVLADIFESNLPRATKEAVWWLWKNDISRSVFIYITTKELVARVWEYIIKSKDSEQLRKIFIQELDGINSSCISGRLGRIISILDGFHEGVRICISDSSRIGAIVCYTRNMLMTDDEQLVHDTVKERLTELEYTQEQIQPWLDAILDVDVE